MCVITQLGADRIAPRNSKYLVTYIIIFYLGDAVQFCIKQWKALVPACAGKLLEVDNLVIDIELCTDVQFLPAMQRRRLSPMARMVFAAAWSLLDAQQKQPLVFASQHGENRRNLELLESVARGEDLSPMQFSLSVHNAIAGLWSILRQDQSEVVALATTEDTLEHALLEAYLLLNQGAKQVLVVIAEDTQPELYQPWIEQTYYPYALALVIEAGSDYQLTWQAAQGAVQQPPNLLHLLQFLLGQQHQLNVETELRTWTWQRKI